MDSTEPTLNLKPKVLLVDDSEFNLIALEAALTSSDYQLVKFNSGQAALEFLSKQEVAVILLDVQMPEVDGFEVAKRARQINTSAETPILFVTGKDQTETDVHKMKAVGGFDFILKPINTDLLQSKIGFFVKMYVQAKELRIKTVQLQVALEDEKTNLLENAMDAVVRIDQSNTVTFWNKNAEKIFGWDKQEIIGQQLSMIVPERFRKAHAQGMRKFIETGVSKIQNQRIEIPGLRRNGEEFLMELTVASVQSSEGYRFYSFMRDISEQKRIQNLVAAEAKKLSLITNAIPDAIAYVDKHQVYQFANVAYEEWLQLNPDEIIGQPMTNILNDQYAYTEPYINEVLKGHKARFATKLPKRNGSLRDVDARYLPDMSPDGDVRGFVIIAHDVTEIQKSREIIQNQSKYLEFILNKIETSVLLIEPESGDVKFANEAAEKMAAGLQKNVRLYGDDYQLFDSEGKLLPREMYPRARAARGDRISGLEYTWKTPFGSWDYLMYSDLIPQMHGQSETALLSFLDITKLKEIERKLRQQEEDFKQLANTIPQLAWTAHPNGDIFWYNDRWYDYTGTTIEEMQGWGWQKVHDPEVLPEVTKRYKLTMETGQSDSMEFPLRSKSGHYRWFLTRWHPLKDEDGKVLRWFGTNTDIHEQKLIAQDQAFRANLTTTLNSANSLNQLVLTATESIASYLAVSRCFVTEVNGNNAQVHTDYSKNFPSLTGSYELMQFGPDLVKAWKTGAVVSVEDVKADRLTKDSAGAHLSLGIRSFITVPLIRSGALAGALNVADSAPREWSQRELELIKVIAESVWAEFERAHLLEALKLSTKRSELLAKASNVLNSTLNIEKILGFLSDLTVPVIADWCSIRMLNSKGELEQMSVSHSDPAKVKWAWELEKRFPANENAPQGPHQVIRSGKPELIKNVTDEMIESSTKDPDQVEMIRSLGMRSYICTPITSRGQTVGTITIVVTDESKRQYNEADLSIASELGFRVGVAVENARLYHESQTVNRLKDEFLANLSHELRTPMNVILGHSEILKNDRPDLSEEEIETSIEAIERNAKAQTSIISDLLDVSSIITGKVTYQPEEMNPIETVGKILQGLRPTAQAKNISLKFDCVEAPSKVAADLTRLHQIIWNLVSNAMKFTEPGGIITVKLSKSELNWIISVTDTGLGIDREFLPFVFDRFRQEDASTTRRFGGLGLGLSVVRHLVELHGGYVKADSKGKGFGSTFTVILPLSPVIHSDQDLEMKNHTSNLSNRTPGGLELTDVNILLVEDSTDNRILVNRILSKAGAKVVDAESAMEAREKLQFFKPDVIVSDIGMPLEDGIEFIKKLRLNSTIPAIALTAFVRLEEKEAALSAGFQVHLGKPVNGKILIGEISKLVHH